MNNRRINLEMFSQCRNASSDSKNRKNSVPSMIAHLLNLCRPSAIAGFVISVYIFALNAKCWGAFSHIRVKAFKRIQPRLTNRYAATAVIFVVACFWVGASLNHLIPYGPSSSFGKSMSPIAHGNKMVRGASARFRVLGAQFGAGYEHDISAHATAPPHCNFATAWRSMGWPLANHSELCEWQSCEINKSVSHNSIPDSMRMLVEKGCAVLNRNDVVKVIGVRRCWLNEMNFEYTLRSAPRLVFGCGEHIHLKCSIQSRDAHHYGELSGFTFPRFDVGGVDLAQNCELSKLHSGDYFIIGHNDYSVVLSGGCPASTGTRCVYYAQSANISNQI